MAGDQHGESQRFSKHRAEALSDAVFPIAMTVLVLNLKAPTVTARGQLWSALSADSALWYAIVLTFVTTSMFWMLQHRVFEMLETMSRLTMRLTILTLGFVTMLPFFTSLLGHAKGDPVAYELYFANQSAIALSMALKMEAAQWRGELRQDTAAQQLRLRVWSITIIMLAAVVSARFLPLSRLWVGPISLGLVLRLVRRWVESRRRKAAHR